jgi:hypothetical protein
MGHNFGRRTRVFDFDCRIMGRLGLNKEHADWTGIDCCRNLVVFRPGRMGCPAVVLRLLAVVVARGVAAGCLRRLQTMVTIPQRVEPITQ